MKTYNEMLEEAKSLGYKGAKDKVSITNFLKDKAELFKKQLDNVVIVNNKSNTSESIATESTIGVKTIDTKSNNNLILTDVVLDKIIETIKIPKEFKFKLDIDEIGIPNFDLPCSILNINSFFTGAKSTDLDIKEIKELLIDKYGISIHEGLHRGEVLNLICNELDLFVFSFDILSEIHDKIMKAGLPYEITFRKGNTKSYVGYNKLDLDILNLIDSYGKRLDENKLEINKPLDELNSFNLSSVGYLLIPKSLLGKDLLGFIKVHGSNISPEGLECMRRGMWDGNNPDEVMTRDSLAKFIIVNKRKNLIN